MHRPILIPLLVLFLCACTELVIVYPDNGNEHAHVEAPPIVLSGFWGATQPGTMQEPPDLSQIPESYNVLTVAFCNVDSYGNLDWIQLGQPQVAYPAQIQNGQIRSLKERTGCRVLLSMGGERGFFPFLNVSRDFWIQKAGSQLLDVFEQYGFDGLDIDIETVESLHDFLYCMRGLIKKIKGYGYLVTLSPPQAFLYDYDPPVNRPTRSWNNYAPLLSSDMMPYVDWIQPQFYNHSHGAHSISEYVTLLASGTFEFEAPEHHPWESFFDPNDKCSYQIEIPSDKIASGHPATPTGSAPGGGWLSPLEIATEYEILQSQGAEMKGFMVWSIGWDKTNTPAYSFGDSLSSVLGLPILP
ncbi:MAG: glycosyl hydrolase family 18 protein [Candidatus Krumholzibacteria bacterium]|jgi:chitinase|nr:glycosyl hydrolase family 18 protein [Candidatus Krumholzibacteria bacterium]MDP7021110.1 glycosyl hydrolase family 18 protein [Candidatus Krumholzibacteria bacterium]